MSHYFDPQPAAASRPTEIELALSDGTVRLHTDRGVFSSAQVDPGTVVLLRHSPPPPPDGHLLDLGCGYGPIAITLARRSPAATVWAVDVNERALGLVLENAASLGFENVRPVTPDEVPGDVSFAGIWSNPPIRIGKPALHTLLLRWLGRLAPDGKAWLVVHKHLGADSLTGWLGDQGLAVNRRSSKQGYRVLEVAPR
ncbi:MAG TPA: methyltransferase [Acidimicrobiales bacterium]